MGRIKASNALSYDQKVELQKEIKKKIKILSNKEIVNYEIMLLQLKYNNCWEIIEELAMKYNEFYNTYSQINMRNLDAILDFAGYTYKYDELDKLFSSKNSLNKALKSSNKINDEDFSMYNKYLDNFILMIESKNDK